MPGPDYHFNHRDHNEVQRSALHLQRAVVNLSAMAQQTGNDDKPVFTLVGHLQKENWSCLLWFDTDVLQAATAEYYLRNEINIELQGIYQVTAIGSPVFQNYNQLKPTCVHSSLTMKVKKMEIHGEVMAYQDNMFTPFAYTGELVQPLPSVSKDSQDEMEDDYEESSDRDDSDWLESAFSNIKSVDEKSSNGIVKREAPENEVPIPNFIMSKKSRRARLGDI